MTSRGHPVAGDLVLYNVGSSPHSMGLILDAASQFSDTSGASLPRPCVLVQWVTMDGPTPRQCRIGFDRLTKRQLRGVDELSSGYHGLHIGDRVWYWAETSGGYSTFKVVQHA
jgi:hypothetical protein